MSNVGKIAVLLGGNSAEREVSLKSGNAVLNGLLKVGVDAIAFDPAERDLQELKALKVDKVMIVLHGRGGEDGSIQGALEHLGIPYTGSNVLGSAIAMDKVRTKHIFTALGLPTANYGIALKDENVDCVKLLAELGGKVMVKPANEGSSIGMAMADSVNSLHQAIEQAFKFDEEVLIEQWIEGREFTVSILNGEALPVIEMRTPHQFYDYSAKYQSSNTEYFCPCDLPDAQSKQLQQHALRAFKAVGAKGWGRVDAMQDQQGNMYLLEVNSVPGMTEKSLVPMAAAAYGLSFSELCMAIVKGKNN
ncbi:D-alanine--D-alanine ligase [Flocculibacter collagenilyticus]|uniref:D-alanine--D-alanine ligase n=1 Tax=Flocculibacter collagenilyticus TaxID=2744479 RepID=UPI0018F3B198|nr:D-alanine--D-alanine ligase [Flocculibacter collagenilyticus]